MILIISSETNCDVINDCTKLSIQSINIIIESVVYFMHFSLITIVLIRNLEIMDI